MAYIPALLIFVLCFLLSANANAQRNHSNVIHLGSSLSPAANRTSWLSPSGVFAFGFYQSRDGFAVGIWLINQTEKTIIWTANRDDPAVSSKATLDLTRDGQLLLRTNEQGREVPIADVTEPAASAAMLDSGNFVLYNKTSDVIWESFDFPTDTILGNQSLSAGNSLVSSVSQSVQTSGRFRLDMQDDGNLVAYPVNSSTAQYDAYWSTRTALTDDVQLTLNRSGLLFLQIGESGVHVLAKSSYSDKNNGIIIHRATLDVDGIFRLYSHHFGGNNNSSMLMEWSALPNQCQVNGFCGSNSYCSGMGNKAVCNCYPGFDFIDSSNKFLGCYRNFDDNACRRSKDPAMLYSVVPFENMWLGNYPYSVVQMIKKEDCRKSCLEDCNCGAVLYGDDDCTKYKLPLIYGRESENTSDTAFFKVIRENIIAAPPPVPLAPKVVTESKRGLILILAISFGFISSLCIIFAIYSFIRYRRQVFGYRRLSENANLGLTEEFTLRSFSYDELEKVTCGFKEELGRGPFGAVYKGTISGGNKAVAVKRLEKVVEEGQREFQAEMTAIARTHHRNLVRLLGFCIEGSRKLLVYEYMSNGSVADLLFKGEMRPSWRERVKIALDVARGILYLHEECEVRIIHCNIKPQNILVDETGTAKISDFGLAKLLLPNQSRATTGAEGTSEYSYWAPEQQKNALISEKADTYSFGIVLLEIVCCRSSIEVKAATADEIMLSSWVYQCFVTGKLDKLVEDENVDFVTLERMVKVGLWCIQEDPDLRPSMKNVILMLEGAMHIPVPASPVVSLL
ncbi:G-type lectin S-receptor-like serine/threonine-protein kinase RLK1 [Morella rubra]|uniref:Receptor-like serine/threonine-protein kinase n=1 Tax=Morella rubra TaxID=262757 RepID=A0A6A1WGH7_9ROSI|nr:G-type lectin S-receptor-like serine/threonine-protein kinase RLK1 [Morella rubra]